MRSVFELRRDPITGWWAAIVTDRTFEHASFAMRASPVEGTHCRHCDEAPETDDGAVRRIALRSHAFHRIDSGKESAAQLSTIETLSVRYRTELKPQSQGMKYCLPLNCPTALNDSGTLHQFLSLLVSISWTRPSST